MRYPRHHQLRQGAFTLVELLVVIAIIGILMGLLIPAVFGILAKIRQTTTNNEIDQIATAIENFKSKYNVDYIPSRIKLCERYTDYNLANNLDQDSVTYLSRLWPHALDKWQSTGIDWNGDGQYTSPVTLEGDQCLVYFLGGVPSGTASSAIIGLGFATDPRDPVKLAQTSDRSGPFFAFISNRLLQRPTTATSNGGPSFYCSYYDPYSLLVRDGKDMPYLYFSNYGTANGYNRYTTSDCASFNVQPYFEAQSPAKYLNPKSYQIISAGANRMFGPGGMWTSTIAANIGPNGVDDMSNFNGGYLMSVYSR